MRAIRPRDEPDQDFQNKLRLLMEDFAHVPPDVLDRAVRGIALTHKFLPPAAELNDAVKQEVANQKAKRLREQGYHEEPKSHAINRANAANGSMMRWSVQMQPFKPGDIGESRGCDDATGRVITPRIVEGEYRVDRCDVRSMRNSYATLNNFGCSDEGICRRIR